MRRVGPTILTYFFLSTTPRSLHIYLFGHCWGPTRPPPPHTQADRPPPSVKDPLSRGLHRRGNQDNHTSHRGVRRSLPESCRLPGRPPWEAPSEGKTADRVRGGRHPRSEEDIRANTRPHVRGRGQVHTL
jgi:hypothetical protein